jgi:hypothetical protein
MCKNLIKLGFSILYCHYLMKVHYGWSYRCLIGFGDIGLHYVVNNNKLYPLIDNSLLCW